MPIVTPEEDYNDSHSLGSGDYFLHVLEVFFFKTPEHYTFRLYPRLQIASRENNFRLLEKEIAIALGYYMRDILSSKKIAGRIKRFEEQIKEVYSPFDNLQDASIFHETTPPKLKKLAEECLRILQLQYAEKKLRVLKKKTKKKIQKENLNWVLKKNEKS